MINAVRGPGRPDSPSGPARAGAVPSDDRLRHDPAACRLISSAEFADALDRRSEIFRTRIMQIMLLVAFVVRPLPVVAAARPREFDDALGNPPSPTRASSTGLLSQR